MPAGSLKVEDLAADLQSRLGGNTPLPNAHAKSNNPSFPLEVLPPLLRSFAITTGRTMGTPPDFIAAAMLYVASAAIGVTHVLRLKAWCEQNALIFLALVGRPNSNKTMSLKFPLRPILKRDDQHFRDYKRDLAEYETIVSLSAKERQAAGIKEVGQRPVRRKIIVQDSTPEALSRIHQDNPRGLALYQDELLGWINNFNRYQGKGEQQFWLSIWSGGRISTDRSTVEDVHIPQAYVPVGGTIQPGVLDELTRDKRKDNGFIDRILFVWLDGLKKPLWVEEDLPEEIFNKYCAGIHKLLDLTFVEGEEPHRLQLLKKARTRLFEFFNNDNKVLSDEAEEELLERIIGKFDIHAARFCLILQLLWWAYEGIEKDRIELPMVERAITLTKFFRAHSLAVFDKVQNETPLDRLPPTKLKVYEALPGTVKTAEGLAIASRLGVKERTFRRMLQDKELFRFLSYGLYEKLI